MYDVFYIKNRNNISYLNILSHINNIFYALYYLKFSVNLVPLLRVSVRLLPTGLFFRLFSPK